MVGGYDDGRQAEEALAAVGLKAEHELGDKALEIWPDTATAIQVFAQLLTQWNVGGMGAVIGLRYEAIHAVMEVMDVPRADRRELLGDLRVMEAAALKEFRREQ